MIFFTAGPAGARQMIVHLKSGNTVVIDYSGTIESISLEGKTDSIIGLKMPDADKKNSQQKAAAGPETENAPASSAVTAAPLEEKENSSSPVHLKWARPIDDENLKNARSKSREGWFGSN